jgi:hypothetical protein
MARKDDQEALYRAGDLLAAQLVRAVAPFQLRAATTPETREAILRLRHAVVVEHGWAEAASMPDGQEHDTFDDEALHLAHGTARRWRERFGSSFRSQGGSCLRKRRLTYAFLHMGVWWTPAASPLITVTAAQRITC